MLTRHPLVRLFTTAAMNAALHGLLAYVLFSYLATITTP